MASNTWGTTTSLYPGGTCDAPAQRLLGSPAGLTLGSELGDCISGVAAMGDLNQEGDDDFVLTEPNCARAFVCRTYEVFDGKDSVWRTVCDDEETEASTLDLYLGDAAGASLWGSDTTALSAAVERFPAGDMDGDSRPELWAVPANFITTSTRVNLFALTDLDQDGYTFDLDCDDLDAEVGDTEVGYADLDGDGAPGTWTAVACGLGAGLSSAATDCDDSDAAVVPVSAADRDGDGVSEADDCDACEAAVGGRSWIRTAMTTWGAETDWLCPAEAPLAIPGDCDDAQADVSPAATERCDAADTDEDCDGLADDASADLATQSTFYAGADGDGFGDPAAPLRACDLPEGAAHDAGDCDDSRAAVSPAAVEVCDAAVTDETCDGEADDARAEAATMGTFYADADGDGLGDPAAPMLACDLPAGAAANALDCNDTDATAEEAREPDCEGGDADAVSGAGGSKTCASAHPSAGGLLGLVALTLALGRRRVGSTPVRGDGRGRLPS